MAKDLIIGGASNYDWDQLRNWINSIRATGFEGDVAIVGTNMKKDTIDRLTKEGVLLLLYGKHENGDVTAPENGIEPHVERFFYIWNYLNQTKEEYRYVIATDTRDVIFQENPTTWMEEKPFYSLFVGSEGLAYKDEPWGNANLFNTFGPFFHDLLKDALIYNVGVIAGQADTMKDLFLMIFQMSVNRPVRVCDQATFNFIMNLEPYMSETKYCHSSDRFVTHLGTTIESIRSGNGEIGALYADNPSMMDSYIENYQDKQPVISEDGYVSNDVGERFFIVHQYDRIPALKDIIDQRYNDA